MRMLAASIIAVAMAFSGTDADGIPGDGDDDGIECVEYQSGAVEDQGTRILNIASLISKTPIHNAWIARYHHHPEIAIAMNLDQSDTAVIEMSNETPSHSVSVALPQMLGQALQRAREMGALKVVVSPEGVCVDDIRQIAEKYGWQYWRHLSRSNSIELLIDLYHQPRDATKLI